MDAELEVSKTNVAHLPHAKGSAVADQARREDSLQARVSVSVVDIDAQSTQFACELTISNGSDDNFSVGQVKPRLPPGITLSEALDTAQAELMRRYDELCRSSGTLLTNSILVANKEMSLKQAQELRDAIKKSMTVRGLADAYFSLFTNRVPRMIMDLRERSFSIEVRSSNDLVQALNQFPLGPEFANDERLLRYRVGQLAAIELNPAFGKSSNRAVTLEKDQNYRIVYILCGTRGWVNPTSFSIGFEIPLARGTYNTSRMEYVSVTVPPGPVWPSVIAMVSAAIGHYIYVSNSASRPAVPAGQTLDLVNAIGPWAVPMLTALIIYNVYDMTGLKEKFTSRRGWRSALFIGFLCGFLNDKILKAVSTLLS